LPLKQQKKRKLTQIFFFPVEEESWQALDIQKKGKKKKKTKPKTIWVSLPSSGKSRSHKAHQGVHYQKTDAGLLQNIYHFQSSSLCFISLTSQRALWGFIIPTLKMRKQTLKSE